MAMESYSTGISQYIWVSWITASLLFFYITDQLLRCVIPHSAQSTKTQSWKWKNIANSFIHSLITGIWSIMCFYQDPSMARDLINTYSNSAHLLVSLSIGYFIHDFMDMTLNHRKRSSYELMFHHICVISCFGLAVCTKFYLGYAVVALLVEVNSVFLHIRQMMIIIGVDKSDTFYRINSFLNIGTFVVFRIAVLGWMTRWLVLHKDQLSFIAYSLGSIGLAVIMVMNIVLFFRICIADFKKKSNKEIANGMTKQSTIEASEDVKSKKTIPIVPTPNLHLD